jgi:DmsE family decaheme c-type cytochrome
MNRFRAAVIAAAAIALAVGMAGAARVLASDTSPTATAVDVEQCKSCHDTAVAGMLGTRHAGLEKSCDSCHGDTSEHLKSNLEKGEPGPIANKFTTMKADAVNSACLQCHDNGHQANFAGSAHDRRNVSCTSCHSVHAFKSTKAQLKTSRDAETCYTCHTNIRQKQMRASHHPVREGLMTCASCHDPHDGTKQKLVSANYVNEKCLECHTEKRGPFLWEHAPVRENCMTCHDAHGSNHEKLLQAKQPFLCQRCHLNTRHPGTLYDGRNASTVLAAASNRAVEHGCRNCHQNIHGGNAPSGPYLGR